MAHSTHELALQYSVGLSLRISMRKSPQNGDEYLSDPFLLDR